MMAKHEPNLLTWRSLAVRATLKDWSDYRAFVCAYILAGYNG